MSTVSHQDPGSLFLNCSDQMPNPTTVVSASYGGLMYGVSASCGGQMYNTFDLYIFSIQAITRQSIPIS